MEQFPGFVVVSCLLRFWCLASYTFDSVSIVKKSSGVLLSCTCVFYVLMLVRVRSCACVCVYVYVVCVCTCV